MCFVGLEVAVGELVILFYFLNILLKTKTQTHTLAQAYTVSRSSVSLSSTSTSCPTGGSSGAITSTELSSMITMSSSGIHLEGPT
jgi:hypothetical protein